MASKLEDTIRKVLSAIETDGLYKRERLISSPQAGRIRVAADGVEREVVNLCANNYLGLADHPEVIAAAKQGLDAFGFGMASVRFISAPRPCIESSNGPLPATSARPTRS